MLIIFFYLTPHFTFKYESQNLVANLLVQRRRRRLFCIFWIALIRGLDTILPG